MPKKSPRDTPLLRRHRNQCFVCGQDNLGGMHLKFTPNKARDGYICRLCLDERFTGPPGHCHGGIIATILDEAMGKVNRLRDVVALTSQITVDYLKPVPLNQALRVESREVRVEGRRHINEAEILNRKREVLARGRATFIAIDPERMFAKHLGQPGPRKSAARGK